MPTSARVDPQTVPFLVCLGTEGSGSIWEPFGLANSVPKACFRDRLWRLLAFRSAKSVPLGSALGSFWHLKRGFGVGFGVRLAANVDSICKSCPDCRRHPRNAHQDVARIPKEDPPDAEMRTRDAPRSCKTPKNDPQRPRRPSHGGQKRCSQRSDRCVAPSCRDAK